MRGEFRKRIETLNLDEELKQKLFTIIEEAGTEFPCIHCSSNDNCENFHWYIKWFNNKIDKNPF